MKDNKDFMANPLIQELAKDKNWTVSTDTKMPVDAHVLLSEQRVKGASFKEKNPLTSLYELNKDINLEYCNRTYYFHARDNYTMIIDVEKTASEETKQFFMQIPCDYAETSMSGKGMHILIKVPKEWIEPEAEYLFTDISVIKLKSGEAEFMFNDHFCTFTKEQIPRKQKDINNETHKEIIKDLLRNILKIDKEDRIARKEKEQIAIDFQYNEEHPEICDSIINIISDIEYKNTLEKYNYDNSRYESSYALFVIMQLEKYIKKALKKKDFMTKELKQLTDNDKIYITWKTCERYLEPRSKHKEMRDGLPWLLYVSINSYKYSKRNDKGDN